MPYPLSNTEIKDELARVHDDRSGIMIASSVTCIVAAIIAVILRLLTRRLGKAKILADDYLIITAFVFCMGQVAAVLYSVHLGAGKHITLLKGPPAFAKTIIAEGVLNCVGTSAFKFSALLLFHRIFGSVARFTASLWIVAAIILANNIAKIFLSIFQCNSVHKAWELDAKGSCVNILLAACIPGAINVVSDVVTVLLPIPMIWNLHMKLNRKVQLVGIFLLSDIVCIASTYRIIVVKRLSHEDASWAVVENAIGVVCAGLPTMRPIYSFLVCGHHGSSTQQHYCERCSARSKSESPPSNDSGGALMNRKL